MPIKLKVYKQKWHCPTDYPDECDYPKKFDRKKRIATEKFRGYEKMAEWLEQNPQYADHVMITSPLPLKRVGAIKKVVFDGIEIWVEKYGRI